MKYSKGIMWLDDCRIPFVDEGDKEKGKTHDAGGNGMGVYAWNKEIKQSGKEYFTTQGRFTPNLLVCDDMLNDGSVSKSNQKKKTIEKKHNYNVNFGIGENYNEINDSGSSSRYYDLDKWFDKMLNEIYDRH